MQVDIYLLKRRFLPLKPPPFCGRGPRVTPKRYGDDVVAGLGGSLSPRVTPKRYGDWVVLGGGPGLNRFPGSLSLSPMLPGSLSLTLFPGSLSLDPLSPGSLSLYPLSGSRSLYPLLLLECSGPRSPFRSPSSPFNRFW